jgi:hypothetical protein
VQHGVCLIAEPGFSGVAAIVDGLRQRRTEDCGELSIVANQVTHV